VPFHVSCIDFLSKYEVEHFAVSVVVRSRESDVSATSYSQKYTVFFFTLLFHFSVFSEACEFFQLWIMNVRAACTHAIFIYCLEIKPRLNILVWMWFVVVWYMHIIHRSCVLGRFWVETSTSRLPLLRAFMIFHVTVGIIRQNRANSCQIRLYSAYTKQIKSR
jgi:hypothetical protein